MEIVMGGSSVGDGCEVGVVVELWLCWTMVDVVAELLLRWATGVNSSVY